MAARIRLTRLLLALVSSGLISSFWAGAALAGSCDDQRGTVIFEDNFSDDSGGWGWITDPNMKFGGGTWSLHLDPKYTNAANLNTTFNAQDADYCMEFVVPKSVAPGNAVALGVAFWATDYDNFYVAAINSNGRAALFRKAAAKWQNTFDLADPGVKFAPGSIAAVRVLAIGNIIAVSVNGIEVKRIRAQMPTGALRFGIYFETQDSNPPPGASVSIKRYRVTSGQ